MSLSDDFAASQDQGMQARVQAAIYLAAQTIYTEASPPANHALRATFATRVLAGQVQIPPLVTSACCFAHLTNLSTGPSTDVTINNAVAACWNTWAGA